MIDYTSISASAPLLVASLASADSKVRLHHAVGCCLTRVHGQHVKSSSLVPTMSIPGKSIGIGLGFDALIYGLYYIQLD